jgi:serine/threonine protein kinase
VLLHSTRYSSAIDLWAVGCIASELYTFRPLFPGSSEVDQLFKVCSIMGTPDKVRRTLSKKSSGLFLPKLFQNDWPEGHRLAQAIQFRFPECPKIPLASIITRAGQQALHLIGDLLYWDPDKRPNAQQSQRYPYFMNVKTNASASIRPQPLQQSALPTGRLSIMEVEALDNSALLSRFSVNPKYASSNDMNDINSMLSVSRSDKISDTTASENIKNSAKTYSKFQSNFNVLNDMFNNINMKTDTNNNDKSAADKNAQDILPVISSPKKPEESERAHEKEKINDVFINLLKDQKDPSEYSSTTYNSGQSFFLHEPKVSASRSRVRNDSGLSFKMLSKGARDNSFDEGFFDSLNVKKATKASAMSKSEVVKDWDEGMEDDELASILG